MATPGFIEVDEAAKRAFELDVSKTTDEERFIARVYLRLYLRIETKGGRDGEAKVNRINARLKELA